MPDKPEGIAAFAFDVGIESARQTIVKLCDEIEDELDPAADSIPRETLQRFRDLAAKLES